MAAVIMVDRSASDSGRGVATAATNPSGAPADRVRSLKSIFKCLRTEKGSDGRSMPDQCPGAPVPACVHFPALFMPSHGGRWHSCTSVVANRPLESWYGGCENGL